MIASSLNTISCLLPIQVSSMIVPRHPIEKNISKIIKIAYTQGIIQFFLLSQYCVGYSRSTEAFEYPQFKAKFQKQGFRDQISLFLQDLGTQMPIYEPQLKYLPFPPLEKYSGYVGEP
ncbi:UNKNOWN [Stylonychia lemnae]|uniref:Uncharacterized protein n=1 Tax=Stylonychia lemnae TaxID=5949 RepID=A0A078AEV4_STYLE|nr:UNKNOWN [Stylonychia lemnae]|eukprot:CDW80356.1 UNKNOWN [Stylonychia lemnae]